MPYKAAWGSWGRFIKLKFMEHACNARSEAEMAAHAHLSNHAQVAMHGEYMDQPQTPNRLGRDSSEGGHTIISDSE